MPDFKINNNHSPYFARHFHWRYPEYDKFFELRETENKKLKQLYWTWVNKDGRQVFELFCQKAMALIARGKRHYSADAILHVVRFEIDLNENE